MNNSEKIIEINNLTKTFKDLTAVNQLFLNVYRGDVFGFLGPNGAGKSTTIRMLLTLISPTSGSIKIFGESITQQRENILKRIGAIVEKPDFYGYLTAFKNLELLGKTSGLNPTRKQIMEILELVGLEKRWKSKVKTYSHGMKQRLGIAQSLLHDPELIILDEPTTGLDPQGMKEIRDLIILLSKEKGKTIFLSSHILSEVEIVANRMIIINKGTTVVEGTVKDLLNSSSLKVKFEFSNFAAAAEVINNSELIKKVDEKYDNAFIFTLTKEEISGVNKFFVDKNIEVEAIVPKRSLEEYFLQLTEKEK